MSRMSDLGVYFISIFLVIVLFALIFFKGPIMGYFTVTPEVGNNDVRSLSDPRGAIYLQEEVFKSTCNGVDLRGVVSPMGITYVEEEVFDKFCEKDKVRVIINFKRDIEDLSLDVEGFEKKREFENSLSGELKKTSLVKLIDSLGDEIESIQVDHEFIRTTQLDVDSVVPKIRIDSAWNSGLTGKGQAVCVIDTGIDPNHPGIPGKYVGGYDFINNDDNPMDDYGHGTYMAHLILDVAPDAKIVPVKALAGDGKGYESDIIAAIDYCIENRDLYNISVISMSLSGGSFEGYCDSVLITNKANFAAEQGIFVVAAAGNGGWKNLTAPACGTKVTSVGATTLDDSLTYEMETKCGILTYKTNINPLLDILAPGMDEFGGSTSIATAVAAGVATLVLEKESLKPMELEYRLRSTGFVIEHEGVNYSRIDVHNAINNIVTNTPSEQVGEQSEGNWVEYGPALPLCECDSSDDCGGMEYCRSEACDAPNFEPTEGTCQGCIGDGDDCSSSSDPRCEECKTPQICQYE